jgi:hypothetical protein
MWRPGFLRWTILNADVPIAAGIVPARAGQAEQVALDALADYAGLTGLHHRDMAVLTCVVVPDGWPLEVPLATADGRDW